MAHFAPGGIREGSGWPIIGLATVAYWCLLGLVGACWVIGSLAFGRCTVVAGGSVPDGRGTCVGVARSGF